MGILTRRFSLVYMGFSRYIVGTIGGLNKVSCLLNHIVVNADRICTHVRNEADVTMIANIQAFIQLLRQHHGLLSAKVEFAYTFLLHRRSRKWRRWLPFSRAHFHLINEIWFVAGRCFLFPT